MKKDITTKALLKALLTLTKDIAHLLLNLNISNITFIDKELKTIQKREADIVAKCIIDNKEQILHIEIQNNNDKTMPNRMLRYFNDINTKYPNLIINQYLIYIGKAKLSMKDYIKESNLNYKYNILDMHSIDCNELIKLDTPDALVLSILCDFKGKDSKEVLKYLMRRIQELTKDNSNELGKYMLMLETLSTNRNLEKTVKEVEGMLRDMNVEKGMVYRKGLARGEERGKLESAKIMIQDFNLSIKEVSEKLNIPISSLIHLSK
jgi:predicted transposase YdaD